MIQYDSRDSYYKQPFGAVVRNTQVFFRVIIQKTGSVNGVYLVLSEDMGPTEKVRGVCEVSKENEDIYSFSWPAQKSGLYFYYFETTDHLGIQTKTRTYQLTVYDEGYSTPDWMKEGVMYQIFPDRFARSKEYEPPEQNKDYLFREDWGGKPQPIDSDGRIVNNDFFGGNLRGIINRLDYLVELGVTVIYLNPIFQAFSNHRYDTGDFMKIDPMLGTENDFKELCLAAAERGIRIILDGVFSHTGSDSLYFNKNGRYEGIGAYQSKLSPYYSWYRFKEYPNQYDCWWGIDTLPSVNETEPSYIYFILKNPDSVVKHWLKCGASGFRLDVADELPDEFLFEMRSAVKSCNKDAVIIGEVWEDASNKISYGQRRRYLQGKQLDSVMNYPLKNAIIDFLVYDHDGEKFREIVNEIWENYPAPSFSSLMNILGTHDTVRIRTVLSDVYDDGDYCRQRQFLAILLWAMMPGIPCIYYGDEMGMKGGRDPMNRLCFDPGKGDPTIFMFYKRLIAFRNGIEDLIHMNYSPGPVQGSFYSFYRQSSHKKLIVAVNSGNEDYILNLELDSLEMLRDFFISGSVSFESKGVFRIKGNSGVLVYISTK